MANPLRDIVEVVARALVDHPESVRVSEHERRGMTVLELKTAAGDMGKIIGRRGRVAQAVRTVVRAVGAKEGAEVNVDIQD